MLSASRELELDDWPLTITGKRRTNVVMNKKHSVLDTFLNFAKYISSFQKLKDALEAKSRKIKKGILLC